MGVSAKEQMRKKVQEYYHFGEWAGYVNYECKKCPFKTVNRAMASAHINHHETGKIPEPEDFKELHTPLPKENKKVVAEKPSKKKEG